MRYTLGFADSIRQGDHFQRHGSDFGAATPKEYEALADLFLGGPASADVLQGTRASNGDLLRYNRVTGEFGILTSVGIIRTYYRPDPAVHGCATNEEYFLQECKR